MTNGSLGFGLSRLFSSCMALLTPCIFSEECIRARFSAKSLPSTRRSTGLVVADVTVVGYVTFVRLWFFVIFLVV